MRELVQLYAACAVRGYDPVRQVAHFLATGEPTYITAWAGARQLARHVDRYVALEALVRRLLTPEPPSTAAPGRLSGAGEPR